MTEFDPQAVIGRIEILQCSGPLLRGDFISSEGQAAPRFRTIQLRPQPLTGIIIDTGTPRMGVTHARR
jgi:hypothetical protein